MKRAMKELEDTAYSGPVSMTGINVLAKAFSGVPFLIGQKRTKSYAGMNKRNLGDCLYGRISSCLEKCANGAFFRQAFLKGIESFHKVFELLMCQFPGFLFIARPVETMARSQSLV